MRLKSRAWFLISLALFLAAGWVWHLGNEKQRQAVPIPLPGGEPREQRGVALTNSRSAGSMVLTSTPASNLAPAASLVLHPLRLSNTSESLGRLLRSDSALLLRNAFINTTNELELMVPEHLRSQGDPGSYIVQARGLAGQDFQSTLTRGGATLVAYVPNNAFLVTMTPELATTIRGHGLVRAVQPFEPYFKFGDSIPAKTVTFNRVSPGRSSP